MSRANNFCSWMHDDQLKLYHAMGLDDYEVCERWFTDHGKRFSADQIRKARNRLHLPVNRRLAFTLPALKVKQHEDMPNPLVIAQHWLGSRLIEKPAGYFLDGVPASTTTIMRATNAMRVRSGQKQLDANVNWVVP